MSNIANTPAPPYYAVIFTSVRTDGNNGYNQMSKKMLDLASVQPGFLGIESATENIGITISYWKNLDSINQWKTNVDHVKAQELGRNKWYSSYRIRISKVEREYGM
ncbi:MAG: antibiotic biosynthesis monooxygenase [Gammaproteobacteria bacterium]|nr:antibiotic biosynthesis monooxygenase [Gammaproteobacteria bacterium]